MIILVFIFFLLFAITFILYLSGNKQTKLPKNFFYNPESKKKYHPDLDTINWDLHKNRLKKFGRSQYKGLTFFIDDQGRIFYLTEDRKRVYC